MSDETEGPEDTLSGPVLFEVAEFKPTSEPIERETMRSTMARWIVYAFVGQLAVPFIAVLSGKPVVDDVLKILTITISPTVAILGAIMGFYYGSNPNKRD